MPPAAARSAPALPPGAWGAAQGGPEQAALVGLRQARAEEGGGLPWVGEHQAEIVRLGGAAAGIRHDVIDLQQLLGAAAAPAGAVHVAAATRSRRHTSRLTAAGMARPVTPVFAAEVRVRGGAAGCARRSLPAEAPRLQLRSGVGRRLRCRSVRAVNGFVSRLRRCLSRYLRRRSLLGAFSLAGVGRRPPSRRSASGRTRGVAAPQVRLTRMRR